jgi:hypothetical protein
LLSHRRISNNPDAVIVPRTEKHKIEPAMDGETDDSDQTNDRTFPPKHFEELQKSMKRVLNCIRTLYHNDHVDPFPFLFTGDRLDCRLTKQNKELITIKPNVFEGLKIGLPGYITDKIDTPLYIKKIYD